MSETLQPKEVIANLVRAIDGGDAGGETISRAEALARRGGELRGFADFLMRVAAQPSGKADPRTRARLAARAGEIFLRELEDEETAKDALFRVASRLLSSPTGEEPGFELLHRIFEIDPSYAPLLRAVGDYHRADGEPGEAWPFYSRYLDAAPGAADAGVVELRMAQIALGYEEEEQAAAYLVAASRFALPEEELFIARTLGERLRDRRPEDGSVAEALAWIANMERDPKVLERDLHKAAMRARGAERSVRSRRLGRLREVRLGDLDGAGVAYRDALRHAPDDLESLAGAERAFASEPAAVLALAEEAVLATTDPATQRQLHLVAARIAARLGRFPVETDHRLAAFRISPEDPVLRRQARTRLRKEGRWLELLEVLREEATHADRVAASLEGAELIAGELGNAGAAIPWADDALRTARELGREEDARRAEALLDRLGSEVEPEASAVPAAAPLASAVPAPALLASAVPAPALVEAPEPEAFPEEKSEVSEVTELVSEEDWVSVSPLPPPVEEEEEEPPVPEPEPEPEPQVDATREPDPDLHVALAALARGRELESQGQPYAACLAYEKALESMPRMREPLERLSTLHESAGRREDALSCIERLMYVVDSARERAFLRARRAALARDRSLAAENLREAMTLAGDDREILDCCVAAASAHELWDLYALATKRRSKLDS